MKWENVIALCEVLFSKSKMNRDIIKLDFLDLIEHLSQCNILSWNLARLNHRILMDVS